jgi:thiol-disulfide isomerase/thioredoxin
LDVTDSTVNRRDLLAGLAGAALTAAAGCTQPGSSSSDAAAEESATVETIDAPGSEAGTVTIPHPERITLLEFFATTCSTCAAQMDTLREAHQRLDGDILFVSVTSEPVGQTISRADLAAWWDEHGGAWPVGLDDGLSLARQYDATTVPTALILTPGDAVAWRHTGRVDAPTIVDAVQDAQSG